MATTKDTEKAAPLKTFLISFKDGTTKTIKAHSARRDGSGVHVYNEDGSTKADWEDGKVSGIEEQD